MSDTICGGTDCFVRLGDVLFNIKYITKVVAAEERVLNGKTRALAVVHWTGGAANVNLSFDEVCKRILEAQVEGGLFE
jgi:hypothetical protein